MVRGRIEGQRGGGAGLVGLSVEGWRLSVMWSCSPEKKEKETNNNRKHGLDRLY